MIGYWRVVTWLVIGVSGATGWVTDGFSQPVGWGDLSAVQVASPSPIPRPYADPPRYVVPASIQTPWGTEYLPGVQTWLADAAAPMYGDPTGQAIWTTHPAGSMVQTEGYLDLPSGRWYAEIYTGTGWIQAKYLSS